MHPAERAKIFAPFDALSGLREALAEKERRIVSVPRAELSEDQKEALDRFFQEIRLFQLVSVIHFDRGNYLCTTGMLTALEPEIRTLTVVRTRIAFEDVYEIRLLQETPQSAAIQEAAAAACRTGCSAPAIRS